MVLSPSIEATVEAREAKARAEMAKQGRFHRQRTTKLARIIYPQHFCHM